jgi:AcrR family transcriptional regulator
LAVTTAPDPEDLTARARIRDAAMQHFGEHGFERATIRGIAETAGVSSGLVRHHFGSKQGLRDACDDHLIKVMHRMHAQALDHPGGGPGGLNPAAALGPYQRYLARALTDGSAVPLFDEMVDIGERWLAEADKDRADAPFSEPRARATLITAMALSVTVLYQHVSRSLGVDLRSPEGERLLMRTLLDVYSHPLISEDEAAAYRAALDRAPGGATPR